MVYTILGFSKFKSKKGNMCVVLQVSRDFLDRELELGSCGVKVEEVFLSDMLSDLASPENVGRECRLYYNRNGYLDSFEILK